MAIFMQVYDSEREGAYKLPRLDSNGKEIWMKKFAEGCVVRTGEINGYHDSDFYAVFYDPASDSFKRVEYATTRFPTYNNHAVVDATPEVMEKYRAILRKQDRDHRAWIHRERRKKEQKIRRDAKLTYREWREIINAYRFNDELLDGMFALLATEARGRMRSEFRKSLARQVREWLATPSEERKYKAPLSARQLQYL